MKNNTRQMVMIAVLTALSVALYWIEIPHPGAPFLKFDLSDVPVLMTSYLLGIGPAILVALLKNFIHAFLISKDAMLVGELANFAFSVLLILSLAFSERFIHFKNIWLQRILRISTAVLISIVVMHFFNYYITFPLYGIHEGKNEMLLISFLPFNITKATVLFVLHEALMPYLKPYRDRRSRIHA